MTDDLMMLSPLSHTPVQSRQIFATTTPLRGSPGPTSPPLKCSITKGTGTGKVGESSTVTETLRSQNASLPSEETLDQT
jgi:hypothetical protein